MVYSVKPENQANPQTLWQYCPVEAFIFIQSRGTELKLLLLYSTRDSTAER